MHEIDSEVTPDNSPARWSRIDFAFLLFVSIFIFLQLFILPFTPVYVEGDQLLPVSNAMRIIDGQVMYRDFFHFAPPGADYYYAVLFSIFGTKIWVMNATVFALAVAQLLLLFAFSKKLLSGAYVHLPTLLYFAVGFRQYGIDGSYRLFSVVFVLAAVLIVWKGRSTKYLFVAGALCGLASFFVQTRGMLGAGAIGLYLLWTHYKQGIRAVSLFREWMYVASAFIAVVVLTQFYPAYAAGFDNYYFANITFLKDYYGSDSLSNTFAYFTDLPSLDAYLNAYGTGGGWFRFIRVAGSTIVIYAIVPATYLVYFIYRKLTRIESEVDSRLMLLSIVGLVFFIGVSAPTALRLYHIAISAVVVFVWLLQRVDRRQLAGKLLTGALVTLCVLYSIQRQVVANVTLDLPAGRTAFLSADVAEKYKWLANQTTPGDAVYEAQHPTFYFPLHLKNPTPFYLVRDNNYTPVFQVDQLMQALENSRPRFIIWHGGWSKEPQDRKPGDNLAPLWDFIRTNYELIKEFREFGEFTTNSERDIEFWELKN